MSDIRQTSPNSFFPSIVIVHSAAIAASPNKAMVMACTDLTTGFRPQRNYRSPPIREDYKVHTGAIQFGGKSKNNE